MRTFILLLSFVLCGGYSTAKESLGDIRRKWTRYVSSSRIKEGMPRVQAERLLAARLIAAKTEGEGIMAYYELDSEYMVCVQYDLRKLAVYGRLTLLSNDAVARKHLIEWASK